MFELIVACSTFIASFNQQEVTRCDSRIRIVIEIPKEFLPYLLPPPRLYEEPDEFPTKNEEAQTFDNRLG